ncbi:MAG: hypothetical protein COA88_00530 [Kordia sp.]|nr:MAG: hypothetical protein COA88_00530 [Kordia sp.]
MKKAISVICILLFCSCNYFEKQKIHATDELIQERLDSLDTSTIDKYPIFNKDCEQLDHDLTAEKYCFITSLSTYIGNSLFENKLVLENELDTTFQVAIEISDSGKVTIISFTIDAILKENIPQIEQLVQQSIDQLPEVQPALKKIQSGELVPVKTHFIIPIRVVAKVTDN